jgi:hypothetical protein
MTPTSTLIAPAQLAVHPARMPFERHQTLYREGVVSTTVDAFMRGLLWCFLSLIERQDRADEGVVDQA